MYVNEPCGIMKQKHAPASIDPTLNAIFITENKGQWLPSISFQRLVSYSNSIKFVISIMTVF